MKDRAGEVVEVMLDAGWKVDECHDLLHRPFAAVCWRLPGGPGRHLALWWRYQGTSSMRRHLACKLGRHRYLPYWSGHEGNQDAPDGLLCLDCGGC